MVGRKLLAGTVAVGIALVAACSSFSGGGTEDTSPDADTEDALPMTDAGKDAPPVTEDSGPEVPPWATPLVDAGFFRIEAHEVTGGQFLQFKIANGETAGSPWVHCPNKATLGPLGSCPGRIKADDVAVNCVDWCDADTYCRGIGRHLCGTVQGLDSWGRACGGPAGNALAYGPTSDGGVCNTAEADAGGPVRPGTFPACVGSVEGLYDMSGNVSEWIDRCVDRDGGPACAVRGDRFAKPAGDRPCAFDTTVAAGGVFSDVGFRCCAD